MLADPERSWTSNDEEQRIFQGLGLLPSPLHDHLVAIHPCWFTAIFDNKGSITAMRNRSMKSTSQSNRSTIVFCPHISSSFIDDASAICSRQQRDIIILKYKYFTSNWARNIVRWTGWRWALRYRSESCLLMNLRLCRIILSILLF